MKPNSELPASLLKAIQDGNCVAFVGSGFSAAANFPTWQELLRLIAKDLWPETEILEYGTLGKILGRKDNPSPRELEMAAQFIFDQAEADGKQKGRFLELMRARFILREKMPDSMEWRIKHLQGIPFRAIITTNFDPLLNGEPPSSDSYLKLLRPKHNAVWSEDSVSASLPTSSIIRTEPTLVVQLHGSLQEKSQDSLVFTRSQYRSRLYANPAYLTVLRSLLATTPVLFLGYSLTDAYLNELRSELVEAFSKGDGTVEPLAWAVLEDVSDDSKDYFLKHEGLGIITYDSKKGEPFSEFDRILKDLYEITNPVQRLRGSVESKRILWLDPRPENNEVARDLLKAASSGAESLLFEVETFEEAKRRLNDSNQAFDLVISHWGHVKEGGEPNGLRLLREISKLRGQGREMPPTIIFASSVLHDNPDELQKRKKNRIQNRRLGLKAGAVAYVTEWKSLMETIESLLGDDSY